MVEVTNNSSQDLTAAVNEWYADKSSTDFFPIKVGASEVWTRSDTRGFILTVKQGSSDVAFSGIDQKAQLDENVCLVSYFLEANTDISLDDDGAYYTKSKQRIPFINITGNNDGKTSVLTLVNTGKSLIKASVNKGESDKESGAYYPVESNDFGTWQREGRAGFVLFLKALTDNIQNAYYVRSNSFVNYENGFVFEFSLHSTDNAVALNPLKAPSKNTDNEEITLFNQSGKTVSAAINKWDEDNNVSTLFFDIDNNEKETWKRKDERGYILTISTNKGALQRSYYICTSTKVHFYDDNLFCNGNPVTVIEAYSNSIYVENTSNDTFKVSVNQWDANQDTQHFDIEAGSSRAWSRRYQCDYVMSVNYSDKTELPYYSTDTSYFEVAIAKNGQAIVYTYDRWPRKKAEPLTEKAASQDRSYVIKLYNAMTTRK
ncbi:hypothetical protein [Pseudovibrio sp. Alg231-02]|uniref:hypothetical protein n=1 Tax=Pseudovibrio sp. Alg231-02 TaxID=1922223 RepID=UPI000D558996|nr:hypothetical protein [Pseudovibrio sp. Alg231-02]